MTTDLIVSTPPADRVCGTTDPLVDLTHRLACEAANLYAISPWLAGNEKPAGWRECMSRETRAAVEHIEETGLYRFVHESEVEVENA